MKSTIQIVRKSSLTRNRLHLREFCFLFTLPSLSNFFPRKIHNLSRNQFLFPEPKLDLTDDDETLRETISSPRKVTSPASTRHKTQESFVEPISKPLVSVSNSYVVRQVNRKALVFLFLPVP